MSDALWLGGLALVLGVAHMLGGMLLLVVVAVIMTLLFKGLGDRAAGR